MARPTKLTAEILRDTNGYIEMCAQRSRLPTLEGLCVVLNLSKHTVQEWRKPFTPSADKTETEIIELVHLHEEFSALCERMLSSQADTLVNKGLDGIYNPTITKLMLSKHGYREAIDTDITTGGEKMGTVLPEIVAEADRLLKIKKLSSG